MTEPGNFLTKCSSLRPPPHPQNNSVFHSPLAFHFLYSLLLVFISISIVAISRSRQINRLRFSLVFGGGGGVKVKVHPITGHEGPKRESRYSSALSLTSALDGRWVVNATLRPLYPRKRQGTNCIGGWVGPRAGLDGCGKSHLQRDSIPGPSSP